MKNTTFQTADELYRNKEKCIRVIDKTKNDIGGSRRLNRAQARNDLNCILEEMSRRCLILNINQES